MRVEQITILAGSDKQNRPEAVSRIDLYPGDSLAVVGPTGSGKSELLSDIEQAVNRESLTGRTVLINGEVLLEPPLGLVATLSQKTNFVMDATVDQFVHVHAESKGKEGNNFLEPLLALANTLCGEPITAHMNLQMLSGGQSRALMIADIALISDTPIVLIDEVENAGIDKFKALATLTGHQKIVVCATHDPVLILMNATRLVMANGAMNKHLTASTEEKINAQQLKAMDDTLLHAREALRHGQLIHTLERF